MPRSKPGRHFVASRNTKGLMLSAGQEVNTKFGAGVVVAVGAVEPDVYVRIHSSSRIYLLDSSEVFAISTLRHDLSSLFEVKDQCGSVEVKNHHLESEHTNAAASIAGQVTSRLRGQMKTKKRVEETPLAVFVRARLAELGMKQSEFCRLTGFDQGLLSKIQSSMISKLNLETALRLAVGLSVSPKKIFALIGRTDLHALTMKAYQVEIADLIGLNAEEAPAPVLEISQLALRAHALGRNLAPVIDLLAELVSIRVEQTKGHSAGDRGGEPV